jgi:hypothetical protein
VVETEVRVVANYRVRLAPKNEGLEYKDESGTYRFDVSLSGRVWTLVVPGSRGDSYERYLMNQAERNRILPRVIGFLERVKWFGIFPRSYSVRVVERPAK